MNSYAETEGSRSQERDRSKGHPIGSEDRLIPGYSR